MGLIADMQRFGPAPTRERELAAAAVNLVLAVVAGGVLMIVWSAPLAAGVLGALIVAHVTVRLVVFVRRERRGRSPEQG